MLFFYKYGTQEILKVDVNSLLHINIGMQVLYGLSFYTQI